MISWEEYSEKFEEVSRLSQSEFKNFLDIHEVSYTTTCGAWNLPVKDSETAARIEYQETVVDSVFPDKTALYNDLGGSLAEGTTIHHLFHLALFVQSTGIDLADVVSVTEWGGGYGNMARLFSILYSPLYQIYDLPGSISLQKRYLQECGLNGFVYHCDSLENIRSSDLFISTWALSESSVDDISYVVEEDWFDCKAGLLAWSLTDFPGSKLFDSEARKKCSIVKSVNGAFYGFWY